jgi:protein-disulfide isomerase
MTEAHLNTLSPHHFYVSSPAETNLDLSRLLLPIQPEDHVQGPPEATFTLVEYGDYECPDCGQLFVTLCALRAELGDDMRLAFRHYPRSGIHPRAQQAAEAAEAAGAQGLFWDMHDLLFRHQSALKTKHLNAYARQLNLDSKQFSKQLKNRAFEQRVREDFRRGVANGVYGTPGLFINGVRYSGLLDRESLLSELKQSN